VLPTSVANTTSAPYLAENPPTPTHSIIGDTGSSGNYIALRDVPALDNLQPSYPGIQVSLPNGQIAVSTHTGTLRMPWLPPAARVAHVFPFFAGSLLSIGLLCDSGLSATYDADRISIWDGPTCVMAGTRCPTSRLYMLDMLTPSPTALPGAALHAYFRRPLGSTHRRTCCRVVPRVLRLPGRVHSHRGA